MLTVTTAERKLDLVFFQFLKKIFHLLLYPRVKTQSILCQNVINVEKILFFMNKSFNHIQKLNFSLFPIKIHFKCRRFCILL